MYRRCVAVVVLDTSSNLCLVGKRAGTENGWQFPQGGVDFGESDIKAAQRELFEEMGVRSCAFDSSHKRDNFNINICCAADIDQAISDYCSEKNKQTYLPSARFVKSSGPYKYCYPSYVKRKEVGQEQFWFLAHKTDYIHVNLNDEFSDHCWMKASDVLDTVVDFKKDVYKSALKDLNLL